MVSITISLAPFNCKSIPQKLTVHKQWVYFHFVGFLELAVKKNICSGIIEPDETIYQLYWGDGIFF